MGYVSSVLQGLATYAFELDAYDGGIYTVLNSTAGSALPVSNAGAFSTHDPHSSGPANTSFTQTLNYTTGATAPTGVIALKWSSANSGTVPVHADYFGFDDVTLTINAVPEPSTCAVIAGLSALGCVAWRRRHARGA